MPDTATRHLTILLTDIKGFTTFSEQLSANELADALGRYLDTMARIIQQETHGAIDKYIGDAIMALFGVPASQKDDADHAVAAARSMHRSLKLMNGLRGAPALRIGIGLGSGPAIVGKIGSPDRMNYTVIGDPASLASRVEGITQAYGWISLSAAKPSIGSPDRFLRVGSMWSYCRAGKLR